MAFRYPCAGRVDGRGFPEFLRARCDAPDGSIPAFRDDVRALLRCARLTLVASGAAAAFTAAIALAERCGLADPGAPRKALVSGLCAPSSVVALRLAGFDVHLVDVDPETFGLDPDALARAIDPGVALVFVSHVLGFPARVDVAAEIAAQRRIPWILQDARETLGLRLGGYALHAWAAATLYSFDPFHHLSSDGGGAIVTEDRTLHRLFESVADDGRACTHSFDEDGCEAPPEPEHGEWRERPGLALPLRDVNAAYGLFSLESFPSDERRRAEHYGLLFEALTGHPRVSVFRDPFSGATPRAFPVRVRQGSARPLVERLLARGVEVRTLLGQAPFALPAFAAVPHDGLPAARASLDATFLLGVDPALPTEDVEAVGKLVAEEAARGA